jgi:hypothetical protein
MFDCVPEEPCRQFPSLFPEREQPEIIESSDVLGIE